MNKALEHIINDLKTEGTDYADFRNLLSKVKESKEEISKDDILEMVSNDKRIQLHTTPNSVAQLITHLASKIEASNAIDMCCGTGNILYYLQNTIGDLTGVEIVENIALLTKYFIPDLHIINADTFQYPFSNKYDLVVGNLPWGMKVNYDGKVISGEEAFIRKGLDLCQESGELIVMVPYSVLISTQFNQMRSGLKNSLKEIITLPPWKIRFAEMKTALLVIGKNETGRVDVSQLSKFGHLIEDYIAVKRIQISIDTLNDRWDPEFHLLKENNFYKELEKHKTMQLEDLAEIINGRHISEEHLKEKGEFLYLKPIHIKDGTLITDKSLKFITKESLRESDLKSIIQPGDIVISTIFNSLKMYVYTRNDMPAFASKNLAIIRSSEQDYILSYLQTEEGKRVFKTQAADLRKGITIPHISLNDLKGIRIPIIPVAQLNSFGNHTIEKASKDQLENNLEILKAVITDIEKPKDKIIKSSKDLDFIQFSLPSISFEDIYLSQMKDSVVDSFSNKLSERDSVLEFVKNRFDKIELQLRILEKKLDKILDRIGELKTDFDIVRALPRDEEERLFKLCQKIDGKLDLIYTNEVVTIEGYIEEIKRWLDSWDLLDIQSQKFLPIAELIFDELNKIPEADYAPFVVQYCRTLENEILKKLFESYHTNGLTDVNREELVKDDLENSKTGKFALMVKKNKQAYTLGEMAFIMSLLKDGGNSLKTSRLLTHFRAFTISYFDERIVEASFLKDIDRLTSDFRNKAAHPYSIGIDMANQCRELLRRSLNVFLESLK